MNNKKTKRTLIGVGAIATAIIAVMCAVKGCSEYNGDANTETSSVVSSTITEECQHDIDLDKASDLKGWLIIDDKQHGNAEFTYTCNLCGEEVTVEENVHKLPHDTGGIDGACEECGWKNPEKDDTSNGATGSTPPSNGQQSPSNGGGQQKPADNKPTSSAPSTPPACTHKWGEMKSEVVSAYGTDKVCFQNIKLKWKCTVCGEEKSEDAVRELGPHNCNPCIICGYTVVVEAPECSHKNTERIRDSKTTIVGDKDLCNIDTQIRTKVCKDCGEELEVKSYDDLVSSHDFSSRGKCRVCDYEKPEEEEGPLSGGYGWATEPITPNHTEWSEEDDSGIPNPTR